MLAHEMAEGNAGRLENEGGAIEGGPWKDALVTEKFARTSTGPHGGIRSRVIARTGFSFYREFKA